MGIAAAAAVRRAAAGTVVVLFAAVVAGVAGNGPLVTAAVQVGITAVGLGPESFDSTVRMLPVDAAREPAAAFAAVEAAMMSQFQILTESALTTAAVTTNSAS